MTGKLSTAEDFAKARDDMIKWQLRARSMSDLQILEVMGQLPRELFIPEQSRQAAYEDRAVPIGMEQTISQPFIVALMTKHLELTADCRVLEIGTGSGYQTAILARLAGEVYTVDRIAALTERSKAMLQQLGIGNVHYKVGDGSLGWEEFAPYDRIVVTAGAPDVPEPLVQQLCDDGIIVIPTGPAEHQTLIAVTKKGDETESKPLTGCRFVKLVGQEAWPQNDPNYE